MQSFETLTGWCEDPCPEHGTPIRKEYRFGKFGDATVTTFRGCACAVCVNEASLAAGVPLGHEITYHTNYSEAAGRARLIVAQEQRDSAALDARE